MKTRLQTILNANLNPLFSALPCALLLAALGQATLLATQLDEAEDDIEAMFREPFPNHLWLNTNRTDLLAPLLKEAK